jgi:antitoxin VapB
MALNIKDPETENLAAALAARLNTSKTAAIRHALRAQLALTESRNQQRLEQALEVLRTEIWPLTADSAPITKADREAILGYGDEGFSA